MDYSQLLTDKTDTILTNWIQAVRLDRKIESADTLPHSAIINHIPHLLSAMATVLSYYQDSEIKIIIKASLDHGFLRAEQGYDAAEVAREYHLLRQVIFSNIEAELLTGTTTEVVRTFRLIDAVVDEAIAQCFNSYVAQRLSELQQIQTQLTLTNQELNRLVNANQENLSYLAHELKTPLNSIIGYSELFLRQEKKQPEIKDTLPGIEHIERVLRNGRQLLRLVNDALELSRADAGKIQLRLRPTNVQSIISTVVEVMQPMADAKGLKLVITTDCAPKQVIGDSQRLQQIITNLLSNAIRYTATGSIELHCRQVGSEKWAIAITDTGIGIAPEDKNRIFDPFFQAGEAGKQQFSSESTGLGLAIVSRLVKLLQGKIELVSETGVGSTFTVVLPLEVKTLQEV
ncbi:MAG: HAMP domain-containing sensor histidine kinase [Tychonema bourrellyi B0820]|uniref:Circadian input-output histidine kinase CikA n=1 Tax=Tychonema bourrellyi FEM_GT703 TaxID=2040638 RepID=A0A2G4F2W0_9CYAN|nr:HAMP domain-containing sensor histidine kinase [Tychonema bourrellyi]MDQ2099944.1 HAMP domain-containing sensor histidine kinase [Tychonema bourrellyi B0820]PHX56113.1 sensor histidine kinase [Tychonema bourrellyi FEM_GT703]